MGQTLTHGVYLPDEGERNCYSGLAANWQILDTSVGTIAAHTAALSGKAPLVHTHSKADITDFPAYGTTAGTICEGNDSRLSDARTPVAHTHLTSDVTDLLNSAHEWDKEQVCDEGFTSKSTTMERCVTPETIKHINFTFKDKNGKGFGAVRRYLRDNGIQEIQVFGNTKIKDGQYDETGSDVFFGFSESIKPDGTTYFSFNGYLNNSIRPRLTNTYQLGDSSYQWKSVYAQSYYYNGVAWGLDKSNVWTSWQTFENTNANSLLRLRRTDIKIGDAIPSAQKEIGSISFAGSDNINLGLIAARDENSGYTQLIFAVRQRYDAYGNRANNGSGYEVRVNLGIDESRKYYLRPNTNGDIDLGTSTHKWKSFNGVNPGALSLPNYNASIAQDISGDMVPDQYGRNIRFTPTMDGWMYVDFNISNATLLSGSQEMLVQVKDSNIANANFVVNFVTSIGSSHIFVYLPVFKGKLIILEINFTGFSIGKGYVYPCQGNV